MFFARFKHIVKIYNHALLYVHINNNALLYININNHAVLYIQINTHNNYHKKYTQKHPKYFTMIPIKLFKKKFYWSIV